MHSMVLTNRHWIQKANIRQGDMFNFSADKLILFKEKTNVGKEGEMIAYCPIMLLDKSGGNIDSLQYVKTWDASLSIVIEGNENMKAYLWCEVMLGARWGNLSE